MLSRWHFIVLVNSSWFAHASVSGDIQSTVIVLFVVFLAVSQVRHYVTLKFQYSFTVKVNIPLGFSLLLMFFYAISSKSWYKFAVLLLIDF